MSGRQQEDRTLTDEAKMIARSTGAALLHALPAILLMTVVLWTFVLTGALGVAIFIDLELIGLFLGLAIFGAPALWANWHVVRLAIEAERHPG
jgi:hypothetical protein